MLLVTRKRSQSYLGIGGGSEGVEALLAGAAVGSRKIRNGLLQASIDISARSTVGHGHFARGVQRSRHDGVQFLDRNEFDRERSAEREQRESKKKSAGRKTFE